MGNMTQEIIIMEYQGGSGYGSLEFRRRFQAVDMNWGIIDLSMEFKTLR